MLPQFDGQLRTICESRDMSWVIVYLRQPVEALKKSPEKMSVGMMKRGLSTKESSKFRQNIKFAMHLCHCVHITCVRYTQACHIHTPGQLVVVHIRHHDHLIFDIPAGTYIVYL